jgi:transposase
VIKDWEGKSALQLLKLNVLPHELYKLSDDEILTHLRKAVSRAVGLRRISELKEAASHSIGNLEGSTMAKLELRTLIAKYELINNRFEDIDRYSNNPRC